MYLSKTKMGKKELILECFISDFAFLPVNCFQSFSCAKKRGTKATNLLKLYVNCNFSRIITKTLTMLAPMLGLD